MGCKPAGRAQMALHRPSSNRPGATQENKGERGPNLWVWGPLEPISAWHDIEEEEEDYRPTYDPRGIGVTKTKDPEGINGPVLSVNEPNARIDNMLSHLIRHGFEEPLDDDVATEDEMARIDSDIESR
ncbi:hypothetical protein HAX54_040204 [Datura stramonium]|uniref:Uncharacterized protein n=1 Tax=Datura stramonium TaxID=4076 RepID=A0ABS8VNP2_DATST|nr:hypothetical protein [Datura stramonium]